ncbi:histidine ammonia-lyase [Actinoplanes lutulentus]|uniref:Histidine ammonia-lyase n=1 Tax=Actinoplanes lutulentus TaxID=1287878 RepID=A0A327Z2K5_9ACTN|nr:aromatic amino acid lyase [Actinoplanes lutulentus]MBB2943787.1 histidine ammonia-lyase [Actinoplanes lutulentus]RAK29329.1 histidine ammonia-lyase [Actinoplanes lutulentus]
MTGPAVHRIGKAEELGPELIAAVARGDARLELAPELLAEVDAARAVMLAALAGGGPVYGVNTGMGALAGIRLDAEEQARHQNNLMAGRSVGSAPWLGREEARALLCVRLRTLLQPAAGASPELALQVAALLDAGVTPAIPARGSGAAGEIIPLAHAGAALIGTGQVLDPSGRAVDAGPALAEAGLRPYSFGAKEGVAFLEGVPGLTGLAVLAAQAARTLIAQVTAVVAAEHAIAHASLDPWHPAFGDGDPELRTVLAELTASRELRSGVAEPVASREPRTDVAELAASRGEGPPRALQAPVSFRVSAPALAVATRATAGLEAAVDRSLRCVSDSPAFLDGRFVGSAGFAGTDLVAAASSLTTAVIHLAELGVSRLHRLLDAGVTGLTRQLSATPGVDAGMVVVHKRAVGVAHRLRRFAAPALIGPMETSAGQEDVQSFGFEAAECLSESLDGLREVLSCEILAIHQANLLSTGAATASDAATASHDLSEIFGELPQSTRDRPYGRDLDRIVEHLRAARTTRHDPR